MTTKTLIFDIETNGLNPDRVWCIVINGKKYDRYEIKEAVEALSDPEALLVGHNILNFDLPVLRRLYGLSYTPERCFDTMIASRLFRCDREGGHSLEAWGERLGVKKVPDLDWRYYDPRMLQRCAVDVEITTTLYERLFVEYAQHDWAKSFEIEQHIAHWHAQQEANGVFFDVEAAKKLASLLKERLDNTIDRLKARMPYQWKAGKSVVLPFTKAGAYKAVVQRRFGADIHCVAGPFMNIDFTEPNPNSDPQIKQLLYSLGWQPDEWNYKKDARGKPVRPLEKTSPKITESSLEGLGEVGELIKERGMLSHRLSLLQSQRDDTKGLINNIRPDGRVVAGGIPMGTPTGRYTHFGVVNIPKAKAHVPYGKEMRALFIASPGHCLIGSDAAGLESRCEAHYTFPYDNGVYAAELLDGDVHQKNADLWGVIRDIAKNGKYALMYGAQPPKLASTLGIPAEKGQEYFNSFWDGNDALKRLRDAVTRALKKGYLIGLDGRKLLVRSQHSALNMLFQSAGSILVKQATILMNERLTSMEIPYRQVIHMHDEFVLEVEDDPWLINNVVDIVNQCWVDAGEMLKFNVPLVGDTRVGQTWADIH